jgi:hypothetical protein
MQLRFCVAPRTARSGGQPHPPEGGEDVFVSVELRPDEETIASWSGWRVVVDAVTGVESRRDFTK